MCVLSKHGMCMDVSNLNVEKKNGVVRQCLNCTVNSNFKITTSQVLVV